MWTAVNTAQAVLDGLKTDPNRMFNIGAHCIVLRDRLNFRHARSIGLDLSTRVSNLAAGPKFGVSLATLRLLG